MKTQFERMMDGLNDVEAFLAGKQKEFKAHVPQDVDVKAISSIDFGMTQARFSDTFGFSLDAIKHWEGGRRTPESPARTLLTVIDKNPAAVLTVLNPAAFAAAVASSKPTTAHVKVDRKRQTSSGVTKRKAYSAERVTRSMMFSHEVKGNRCAVSVPCRSILCAPIQAFSLPWSTASVRAQLSGSV